MTEMPDTQATKPSLDHREPNVDVITVQAANAALVEPGQLFEITTVPVRGIPTLVWKNAPPTLRDIFELSAQYAERDFIVYEKQRFTFSDHFHIVCTLAHRLQDELGITKGDRIAIVMRNRPEWIFTFWASSLVGAIVVPLNSWWTGNELHYGLQDCGAKVAFVDYEQSEKLRPFLGGLSSLETLVVVADSDSFKVPSVGPETATGAANDTTHEPGKPRDSTLIDSSASKQLLDYEVHQPIPGGPPVSEWPFHLLLGDIDPQLSAPQVDIDPDDDATIFYTSGTTANPKGAVGTHRNICSNLMNLFFINTRHEMRFGSALSDTSSTNQASFLLMVPLFHATGCHAIMITNTAGGGKLVMMHHFDPDIALDLIEQERVTTFGGVPTMVIQMLDSPKIKTADISSVKSISYGGAPAPIALVDRIAKVFPTRQLANGYGLTETSAVTTMNTGSDYLTHPDSVGPAVPVTQVAIVPEGFEADEPDLEAGFDSSTVGELWIKGPQVVRGYWNRPEETRESFTHGWLHTGDLARIDENGFIYIVDRAKDMIIRGGENIYSLEVEDALREHPAVADCAVIGVADPVLGEQVGAVVVLHPKLKVTIDELIVHLKDRLASYKVPTQIWFRDTPLPHGPSGKVLKRALRADILTSKANN